LKNLRCCIFVFCFLAFTACNINEEDPFQNVNVEEYIALLINGEYTAMNLPEFTESDIPKLLVYRNRTDKITNFPRNWISSYVNEECSLGMYVLWTIESIRAVAIESEYLIGRFPSQNPIVRERDGDFNLVPEEDAHPKVAQAYFEWWQDNQDRGFEAFKAKDPLLDSGLSWH
tara:strand:- start:24204 stop:24722 length:519 start_codon:yes stop_codon:yes gene_type:complete